MFFSSQLVIGVVRDEGLNEYEPECEDEDGGERGAGFCFGLVVVFGFVFGSMRGWGREGER